MRIWSGRSAAGPARRRGRRGLTIVEIIVALSIFGAASLALVGMSANVAKRGRDTGRNARVISMLEQEVNRLHAIPYVDLVALPEDTDISHELMGYHRKIRVGPAASTTRWTTVTVTVTPSGGGRSESATFTRTRPVFSPLCTMGC